MSDSASRDVGSVQGGDSIHLLAGECTVTMTGDRETTHRGDVVVLIKPDNTVLVHDADGYQPVAWLTRAGAVAQHHDGGFAVVAKTDNRRLRVVANAEYGFGRYPASQAGIPVGHCPDCDGTLVRAGGDVSCLGCRHRYGLPSGAAVLESNCSCGLPKLAVERGRSFEICLDRSCESLDEAVVERFDREWSCPDCGGDLRILRRGGLIAGCERYPDCETGFSIPAGTVTGECDCGLPVFDTASGARCLDATCAHVE